MSRRIARLLAGAGVVALFVAPSALSAVVRIEPSGDGSLIRITLDQPVPVTDARPEVRVGGRSLGFATVGGRTVTLRTTERIALREELEVWLGARRLDKPTRPLPQLQEQAAIPGIPVGTPVADDPGRPGPFGVATARYTLPDVPVGLPAKSEVVADVMYPVDAPGARPLVLILHGRHSTCYRGREETGDWPCRPGFRPIPSENGYRGMARVLASQGYAVVSIRADSINANDSIDLGGGADARAALVDHHLRLWAAWANTGGAPFANLVGRIDTSRTILVGHSRGGEGVVRAALTRRPDGPWSVRGLALIAPTAFANQPVLGIPTAVLLPTCDGDVSDLQGQRFVDLGRDIASSDTSLRSSVLIVGANHNAFNSEWMPKTAVSSGFNDSSCYARSYRISATNQRSAGTAYVAALVRVALDAGPGAAALLDGSPVHAPSAGPVTVRSAGLGGARALLFRAGDTSTLAGSGVAPRTCRAPTDSPSQKSQCFLFSSPHFLSPPFGDEDLRAAGIAADWNAPGGSLSVGLPTAVTLGGATHLDLRVIVRRAPPDPVIAASLVDTNGAEIPLAPTGDVRAIPGVPSAGPEIDSRGAEAPSVRDTATNWAQTLRFQIPGGLPATAVAAVRLRAVSPRGSVVILDGHLRAAGLPAITPVAVPQINAEPLRVPEAAPGGRRRVTVNLAIRGPVANPAEIRITSFTSAGNQLRSRRVTIPAGATSVPVPVVISGDRAFNTLPSGLIIQVVAVRGITVGRDVTQVEVVDDDPRPGVLVGRRSLVVREGDVVRIRVRLNRPAAADTSLSFAAVPLVGKGRPLSANDIASVGSGPTPGNPSSGAPLGLSGFGSLLFFSPDDLTEVVEFRVKRDRRREGTERARLVIDHSGAGRRLLAKPIVITLAVRDRR